MNFTSGGGTAFECGLLLFLRVVRGREPAEEEAADCVRQRVMRKGGRE